MLKITRSIAAAIIVFSLVSCSNSKSLSSKNVEEIFSLNSAPCQTSCPAFELSLYGDKTLIFIGEENTALNGRHKQTLTDEQFEALLGIIETADWATLNDNYQSKVQNLPTQKFTYNRNGINKRVSRFGGGPESISNLSDAILKFVEVQVFNK
ncbi:DUF6438 domain-containing protein [Marivirga harenae]|uniref:DUF6438 domain-containing protein n=1 Tax=Marivirga harenae TaxID=2010992 RepID=UPI0026E0C6EB|nr:DUF6438 domain-containing protein [Marivirga harenae]WKV13558.1 DUF6438 domain-containing protein [Marivirga harenae]|tara:strand:+ start:199564 stop:200022 length:459 start_codon:yes stop_codon:yes gene_type:complete